MERLTPLNHYEYAGFWARFCAMFLDGIIVVCLETGSGFLIGFILGFIRGATRTYQGYEEYIILGVILSWLIPWLYSAGMESSLRQGTLGKRAMGMIVTDLKGNQISFGKATGRYFGKFVSVFTLGIGYLMAAFTERKQALHDMMAGCLVVKRS
ncbi:MAG: RDD family protein [Verrucomicrobia bacterium]|nr:RDD family protein [Verrucomicrobiota bacterium]